MMLQRQAFVAAAAAAAALQSEISVRQACK